MISTWKDQLYGKLKIAKTSSISLWFIYINWFLLLLLLFFFFLWFFLKRAGVCRVSFSSLCLSVCLSVQTFFWPLQELNPWLKKPVSLAEIFPPLFAVFYKPQGLCVGNRFGQRTATRPANQPTNQPASQPFINQKK